jgi:FMN phosphatase YigB (HAD superfamily)
VIELIVVDAGNTLGTFDSPGTKTVLTALSPLPDRVVHEEARRFLHTARELTDDVVNGVCNALLIDPADWPEPWPAAGFTAYDYTSTALAELAAIAPVVVLSNISVTCGPERMAQLVEQCAPHISRVYTSYGMGMRKPDRRLWHAIAADHDVAPDSIVHVGDHWANDIRGAVWAGCRAVYVNTRHVEEPPADQWPAGDAAGRVAVVPDLRGVPDVLRTWKQRAGAR